MFFELLFFALSNYIVGFIAATAMGALAGFTIPSDNFFLVKNQTRKLTSKMYLPILVCVTLIRLTISQVDMTDYLRLLVVGTVGTMMLREAISSFVSAGLILIAKKQVN